MQQRVLLVPDEGLYLAFRLPPILREAGYVVDALCLAGDSIRHSRYLENVTTLESIEEQIDYLHRHMGKAGHLGQTHHCQGERGSTSRAAPRTRVDSRLATRPGRPTRPGSISG